MKKLAFFAGLTVWCLVCTTALFSQTTFQKYYGDGLVSQHADVGVALADGYIVAGTSNNTNPNYHLFFMKIGLDGQLLWMKHYGAPSFQTFFTDMIEANDGGVLAVGASLDGIATTLLVKTDANGELEWQKKIHSYASNRDNGGLKLCRVDGGYIISGESSRADSHPTLTRIDNKGNTVWSKRYAAVSFDNPRIYACFASGDTVFACGFKDNVATYNLFRASTGDTLYHQWFTAPGALPEKGLYNMVQTPDGELLLAGFLRIPNLPGDISPPNSPFQLWVCRISRSGQLRWSKVYLGNGSSISYWSGSGKIIPSGGDRYTLFNRGNLQEPILTQIDGQGEVLWSYKYGDRDQPDAFFSLMPSPAGGQLAVGGAVLAGTIQERLLLVKTDAGGLVESCCTQPAPVIAMPYPVQILPGSMNRQFDFDPTVNWSIDATPDSLVWGDFCPPLYRAANVPLCPGDSVTIDGAVYTKAGVVKSTVHGPKCDTVFTYTIQVQAVDAAPGQATLTCPENMTVSVPFGAASVPVLFAPPVGHTGCSCPTDVPVQTAGLPSGSALPVGVHSVCFEVKDPCGNQPGCCFQIRVEQDEAPPCDVKTNGCVRFELLRLTAGGQGRRTYHFRIQNNCAQALQYVAFHLPKGVTADEPTQTYTAPGGLAYGVRNPGFSPLYSIQFKPQGQGIRDGESDVFSFTLPPQSAPDYFQTIVKLDGQPLLEDGQPLLEAHLNTFNCPLEPQVQSRGTRKTSSARETLGVFPNPAANEVVIVLSEEQPALTRVRVLNAQGAVLYAGETDLEQLRLSFDWPAGIYFVEAVSVHWGGRRTARMIVR